MCARVGNTFTPNFAAVVVQYQKQLAKFKSASELSGQTLKAPAWVSPAKFKNVKGIPLGIAY